MRSLSAVLLIEDSIVVHTKAALYYASYKSCSVCF